MITTQISSPATKVRQHGISMVESLVALVVLSVGMLGIAGLYVSSLQAGRTALSRTQAVSLVNDMIDRIRANATAGDAYNSSKYGAGAKTYGCVVTNNCTAAKLAEDDLATWLAAAQAVLPGKPKATVVYTKAASVGRPDRYEVQIVWQEAGNETAVDKDGNQTDLKYVANLSMIPSVP